MIAKHKLQEIGTSLALYPGVNAASYIEVSASQMAMPTAMPSIKQDASQPSVSFGDSLRDASNADSNTAPARQTAQPAATETQAPASSASSSSASSLAQISDMHSRYANHTVANKTKEDSSSSKTSSSSRKQKSSDDDSKPSTSADASNQTAAAIVVPVVPPLPTSQTYSLDPQSFAVGANTDAQTSTVQSTGNDDAAANSGLTVQAAATSNGSAENTAVATDLNASAAASVTPAQTQPAESAGVAGTPAAHKADQVPDVDAAAQPAADSAATVNTAIPAQIQIPTAPQPSAAALNALHAVAPAQVSTATAKGQQVAGATSKSVSKLASKDSSNSKSTSADSTTQSDLQNSVEANASNGQQGNSHDGNSQDQNSSPAPVALDNHMANMAGHHQEIFTDASTQSAPTANNSTSDASASRDRDVPQTQVATPEAQPVINTAKLIQSIAQSEMRVGMRSAEFGDISIHTSSTRDTLTAQISLDHADLARTLAAHLPEMHAALGGDKNVEVRVNTNGQSNGFNGGSASSSSDSSGNAKQHGNSAHNTSRTFGTDQTNIDPAIVSASTNYNGSTGRLDIRA